MLYPSICVEGNIGAGKTSLAKALALSLDGELLMETFANNPFLPKLFEDFKRHAFAAEMFFMAERFQQLSQKVNQGNIFKSRQISDFLFVKSKIFANINLNEEEFLLYKRIFDLIYPKLALPELIIYIHQPIDKLLMQIKKRGRSFENQYDANYLGKVEKAYFDFFKQVQNRPVIVLDCSRADFVSNPKHLKSILELCEQEQGIGIHHYQIF